MDMMAFFGSWGAPELVLVGVIAVLLFGRRLPDVGKNLGKSLVEFKKGLKGTKEEFSDVTEAVDEVKQAAKEIPEEPAAPQAQTTEPAADVTEAQDTDRT